MLPHSRRRRPPRTGGPVCFGLAAAVAVGLAVTLLGACGDDEGECPTETRELTDAEADVYRQLEVCASRVTGVALHRDDLPRVESQPELVACSNNNLGQCVTTPAGQEVSGYYLERCDTFTVAAPIVLLHEMLHPVLCGVPDLECDASHASPAWIECQAFKGCPDGRVLLEERVCDGTADCAEGEDELGCD